MILNQISKWENVNIRLHLEAASRWSACSKFERMVALKIEFDEHGFDEEFGEHGFDFLGHHFAINTSANEELSILFLESIQFHFERHSIFVERVESCEK